MEDSKQYQLNKIMDALNQRIMEGKGAIRMDEIIKMIFSSKRTTERLISQNLKLPLSKYFSALRLEYAAHLLSDSRLSVGKISYKTGYEEHAAFTKEFRKRFGVPPSLFRQSRMELMETVESRPYTIEHRQKMFFIYQSYIGNYKTCNEPNFETAYWDQLETFAGKEGILCHPVAYYGIAHDDSLLRGMDQCRFYACIPVERELPVKFRKNFLYVPAGKYAKFIHKGSYADLEQGYETIFRQLIDEKMLLRNEFVLEHYLNASINETSEENLITELYFPIE